MKIHPWRLELTESAAMRGVDSEPSLALRSVLMTESLGRMRMSSRVMIDGCGGDGHLNGMCL